MFDLRQNLPLFSSFNYIAVHNIDYLVFTGLKWLKFNFMY